MGDGHGVLGILEVPMRSAKSLDPSAMGPNGLNDGVLPFGVFIRRYRRDGRKAIIR